MGPFVTLGSLGVANNPYTEIGPQLVLLIALSAKNAILIVEVAWERRVSLGEAGSWMLRWMRRARGSGRSG